MRKCVAKNTDCRAQAHLVLVLRQRCATCCAALRRAAQTARGVCQLTRGARGVFMHKKAAGTNKPSIRPDGTQQSRHRQLRHARTRRSGSAVGQRAGRVEHG
jgi:hypothetical protein